MNDPTSHDAPLRHLVAHVIHKGTSLQDRVRRLRYKRRKPRQAAQPVAGEEAHSQEGLTSLQTSV